MAVDGYLNFNTKIDTKGFNAGTKSINSSFGTMKSMLGKIGTAVSAGTQKIDSGLSVMKSALGKIGVAVAAAFSVKKLVEFSKQAIETASDLQEVQNVVDTAFGDMSYKMELFADSAIEKFGISRLSAKRTGSTFMAMARGMNIANDAASDMAISLTGLSADMASFYNVEQDVASTALKSVFTGETETLKQFGIVMTEANLEAFALSKGIEKSYDAMSQSEKVMLRYAYVMGQTTLAQGDFEKTSDSWANQTRMISEKFKELSSILGSALMQVLLPAVKTLNTAFDGLLGAAKTAYEYLARIFNWDIEAQGAKEVENAIEKSAQNQEELTEETKKTAKAAKDNLQSFDKINKLQGSDEKSSDSIGVDPKLLALSGNTTYTVGLDADTSKAQTKLEGFKKNFEKTLDKIKSYYDKNFSGIFSGLFSGLSSQFSTLKETFSTIYQDIQSLDAPLRQYFNTDFTAFLQTFVETSANIIVGLFDSFNTVFSDIWQVAVFPILSNFITDGLVVITQFATQTVETLGTLFDSVKEIFDLLWSEAAKPALEFLTQIWCDCVTSLKTAWDKWGEPVFEQIRLCITNVKDLFVELWEKFLKPIWDTAVKTAKDVWDNHLKPLLDNVLDLIGELIDGALRIYNEFISPVVSWFVDKFGPPLSNVFGGLVETIGRSVSSIADTLNNIVTALKGVIEFVVGVFTGDWDKAWSGIKTIFSGVFNSLVDLVKEPINGIINIINAMIRAITAGINVVIRSMNSLSFELPDWAGGYRIGLNIPEVTAPQIPLLAKGTVVPASYGEFLAVLGDNKREPEVVSPLSTIKKAVLQAMKENSGGEETINLSVSLDGAQIYKTVVKHNRQMKRQTGVNPLGV